VISGSNAEMPGFGLVDVTPAAYGDVVGDKLRGHDLEDGQEHLRRLRDREHVVGGLGNLLIALVGQADVFEALLTNERLADAIPLTCGVNVAVQDAVRRQVSEVDGQIAGLIVCGRMRVLFTTGLVCPIPPQRPNATSEIVLRKACLRLDGALWPIAPPRGRNRQS
jgi:hypothetical protein